MVEVTPGAGDEEPLFRVVEGVLHLAFALRVAGRAGDRRDGVVPTEAQEIGVPAHLRAAVVVQKHPGVIDQEEATAPPAVPPAGFQRLEGCFLVDREAGEPVDAAGAAEQEAVDVDPGSDPAQRQRVLRPIELCPYGQALLARVGLEAAGRDRFTVLLPTGGEPAVEGGAGIGIAVLVRHFQQPGAAEAATHSGGHGFLPGRQGRRGSVPGVARRVVARQRRSHGVTREPEFRRDGPAGLPQRRQMPDLLPHLHGEHLMPPSGPSGA
jgi:hypothetical protein